MRKADFMERIALNMYDMKQLKINYKYLYDKNERQEMFKIARKISRYNEFKVSESRKKLNEEELVSNFFNSIEIFNSDIIYNYFKNHNEKLTLVRSKKVRDDDAELEYDMKKGQKTKFYLNLPNTPLTYSNQLGFAHELGHIPEIDKPRKSFFEYGEVLPMFMEYIEALYLYDKSSKDNFICERLNMELEEAKCIMKTYKRCDQKNEVYSLYYKQDFADSFKFIESLDYTLQLIDIFEEDKNTIRNEIEKIIKGKSLIDVSKDLDIDTTGCERLLKEYKRL